MIAEKRFSEERSSAKATNRSSSHALVCSCNSSNQAGELDGGGRIQNIRVQFVSLRTLSCYPSFALVFRCRNSFWQHMYESHVTQGTQWELRKNEDFPTYETLSLCVVQFDIGSQRRTGPDLQRVSSVQQTDGDHQ